MRNAVKRALMEISIRLKKDANNFQKLGLPQINLHIGNKIVGSSHGSKAWFLIVGIDDAIIKDDWNPEVSEYLQEFECFDDDDIILAINTYKELVYTEYERVYSKMNASHLWKQIQSVFQLMSNWTATNTTMETPFLEIKGNGVNYWYTLYWSTNANCICELKTGLPTNLEQVENYLTSVPYITMINSLNHCYKLLRQK